MSTVLDKDEADKTAITYTPRKFPLVVSASAREFVAHQAAQTNPRFRMDRVNAEQTGVAELERVSIEQQVEALALEKLKQIQEDAYQEAYQLGLDEGRERAFSESRAELEEKIKHFDSVLSQIGQLKTELVTANEAHLLRLLIFMASRLAMDEIAERPVILNVLKQAVESAQSEERVTARISKSDFEFIQKTKEKLGKEFEFIKRIKLEENDTIQPGGCVVETNYGSVDASIEMRIEKLWEAISEKLPKVNDTVGES